MQNADHSRVQQRSQKEVDVRSDLERSALCDHKGKAAHDMPNFHRSPHKYTAITNYLNEMSSRRIFTPYGKMQLVRQNIR